VNTSSSPSKKKYNLEEIDAELIKIKYQRLELAKKLDVKIPKIISKHEKNKKNKKEDFEKNSKILKNEIQSNSKAIQKPKAKKGGLFHSNLEYVVEKMIHSPYLTKPSGKYPESTFSVPEALRSFKEHGIVYKDIPSEEAPFDFNASKKRFMSEVINFKPKYGQPEKEEGLDDASASLGSLTTSSVKSFNWPAALRDQLNSNFREKPSLSAENREHKMKNIKVKRLSATAEVLNSAYADKQ
jgi:hypothetical protein